VLLLVCQIKLEKDPMKFFVEKEIEKLAKIPFAEIDSSKAGKDDLDIRLKWLGLFHRRKHQCSSLSLSPSYALSHTSEALFIFDCKASHTLIWKLSRMTSA